VAAFAQDLITTAQSDTDHDLQQYVVEAGSKVDGIPYGDLFRGLYNEQRVIPIGLSKPNGDDRKLIKLPSDNVSVDNGDIVILIANGGSRQPLQRKWGLTLDTAP
jgi:hypothetical protein